jgi:hypothetical protein
MEEIRERGNWMEKEKENKQYQINALTHPETMLGAFLTFQVAP